MKLQSCALALGALLLAPSAQADEGMWTYDNFPSDRLKRTHGFAPDATWLKRARLSSVRLAGGCSGSFVSEQGLVMTNHHCAHACIEQLSNDRKDLVERGFYAKTLKREQQCPAMEINQLIEISDVTERINQATKGKTGSEFHEARKAEKAKVEKACATDDNLRCDVVTLYRGGRYKLYKYKRFQDVRLVFAPELDIAFFGGDPDNFNFPRYVLDAAFLRVYEDGKPLKTEHYFKWSKGGAKKDELVFVSGHPGRTNRLQTVAQLEYQRDVYLPNRLFNLAEKRGVLTAFSQRSKKAERIAKTPLFYTENSFKALRGMHQALLDKAFFGSKVQAERALRKKIAADPALEKKYSGTFGAIESAQAKIRNLRDDLNFKEYHGGYGSKLLRSAIALVRYAEEREKPNGKRLREFSDARLPQLKARMLSKAPIYPQLEIEMMTFSLTKMREILGPDDPFVKKALGKESPRALAKRLVRRTGLRRVGARKRLWEGGAAAINKSKDPMIAFAKLIDADGRAIRKAYEEVSSVLDKNAELLAQARFAVLGTGTYPDATFTLRLSFGQVKGFEHRGKMVQPFTQIQGAFERATGQDPFALPRSWIRKKGKLDLATRMNFVTTNDIIGGNSGSPTFNKDLEIVGLIFDGNIYSLGGDYGFDAKVNRAVSVHSELIAEALGKIYGAGRILKELGR